MNCIKKQDIYNDGSGNQVHRISAVIDLGKKTKLTKHSCASNIQHCDIPFQDNASKYSLKIHKKNKCPRNYNDQHFVLNTIMQLTSLMSLVRVIRVPGAFGL